MGSIIKLVDQLVADGKLVDVTFERTANILSCPTCRFCGMAKYRFRVASDGYSKRILCHSHFRVASDGYSKMIWSQR
eukprot:SAG31_NODE_4235_length_3432_cov_1.728773_4_plen_77_part_00